MPSLDTWQTLMTDDHAALRAAAAAVDTFDAASIEQLRRDWPVPLVQAALELADARRKAARKFPEPEHIIADPTGVEQSTSGLVADHKAERFRQARIARVTDLCCGIGGDAMSLARIAEVVGIDSDPARAWMAARNAHCETKVADVTTLPSPGEAVHLDPDHGSSRFSGVGRRLARYEDYLPSPAFIEKLLRDVPHAAVKLGPGLDLDELPLDEHRELEMISERGTLVQAVLWSGSLARHPGRRTATRLPEGLSLTGEAMPAPACEAGAFDRFLFIADPAVERAGLLAALCGETGCLEIHPGLGVLTGAAPEPSPWLTGFELHAHLPWRESKVKAWLAEHDAGIVEVKTRDKVVNPDRLQTKLRGSGDTPWTVFVLRLGQKARAFMTRRV